MADDKDQKPEPKSLADFIGTKTEVLKAKSDYITKHGLDKYTDLVLHSLASVKK